MTAPATTREQAAPRIARAGVPLLIAGIMLLALNLRPALTSLPPIFPELKADLGLGSTAITWLATLPELCFAAMALAAAPIARKYGEEAALGAAVALLAVALVVRGVFPGSMIFPGTIVAASSIAFMNVLLGSLIKRRRPQQAGLLMGLYLFAHHLGAMLGSIAAVPLYSATNDRLVAPLAIWAIPAVIALVIWIPQLRFHTRDRRIPSVAARPKLMRSPLAWAVAAFFGLQSLTYYAALSWFPTMFRDRGASASEAGFLISLMAFGGVFTALVLPILAHRWSDQRLLVAPSVALTAAGVAGAYFAPLDTAFLWMLLLGLSQGATMGLSTYFMVARSATPTTAAALSGMSQSTGYVVAAVGPLLVGLLHAATGAWLVPIIVMLGVIGATVASGVLAGRPLVVDPESQPA
jgi:CP family cyanate transporter-like MFS transporter